MLFRSEVTAAWLDVEKGLKVSVRERHWIESCTFCATIRGRRLAMAMWIQLDVVDGLIGLHCAEVRHLYLFCQTKRA